MEEWRGAFEVGGEGGGAVFKLTTILVLLTPSRTGTRLFSTAVPNAGVALRRYFRLTSGRGLALRTKQGSVRHTGMVRKAT